MVFVTFHEQLVNATITHVFVRFLMCTILRLVVWIGWRCQDASSIFVGEAGSVNDLDVLHVLIVINRSLTVKVYL